MCSFSNKPGFKDVGMAIRFDNLVTSLGKTRTNDNFGCNLLSNGHTILRILKKLSNVYNLDTHLLPMELIAASLNV